MVGIGMFQIGRVFVARLSGKATGHIGCGLAEGCMSTRVLRRERMNQIVRN